MQHLAIGHGDEAHAPHVSGQLVNLIERAAIRKG
jgi:hypothetical protein